jgi:cobalt/nickel transport system ATP-binding protein
MHHNPISIRHLSYTYIDGTDALRDLNLSIRANEKVALIGANGSGKSTLLFHFNGIFLPQAGEVVVGELPVEPKNLKAVRNFVGLVFQNPDDRLFMPTVWEEPGIAWRGTGSSSPSCYVCGWAGARTICASQC